MYNQTAQNLARQGRYGDSMLVHMNPQEVAGLAALARAHGGHISINPKTGLPEAWGIGSIFGSKGLVGQAAKAVGLGGLYSDISKGVSGALQGITKAISPYASFLGLIPGVGVPLAAIVGGLADGKNFNFKRGLLSGLGAYGISSLVNPSMSFAGAPSGVEGITGFAADPVAAAGGFEAGTGVGTGAGAGVGSGAATTGAVGAPDANVISYTPNPSSTMGGANPITQTAVIDVPTATDAVASAPPAAAPSTLPPGTVSGDIALGSDYFNVGAPGAAPVLDATNVLPGAGAGVPAPSTAASFANLGESVIDLAASNPKTVAGAAYMGYTGYKTKQELNAAKEEAEKILADQANKKAEEVAWAKQTLADYPLNFQRLSAEDVSKYGIGTPTYAAAGGPIRSYDDETGSDDEVKLYGGGLGTLQNGLRFAGGGMPPRFLQGAGDGMSDSIPARIGGKQEARLADGEFVVPADVVSHIGNGSSKAGAKKLYDMMDKVRKARTGRTRQAPAINAGGLMPV